MTSSCRRFTQPARTWSSNRSGKVSVMDRSLLDGERLSRPIAHLVEFPDITRVRMPSRQMGGYEISLDDQGTARNVDHDRSGWQEDEPRRSIMPRV